MIGCGEAHGYNVGASIYEQARASPRASLREGGGFCEAKDGRSKRNNEFIQTYLQRVLPQSRSRVTAPSRREPFFISLAAVFLCLISLVSSLAKEETRETRRKEKKEERPRSLAGRFGETALSHQVL